MSVLSKILYVVYNNLYVQAPEANLIILMDFDNLIYQIIVEKITQVES